MVPGPVKGEKNEEEDQTDNFSNTKYKKHCSLFLMLRVVGFCPPSLKLHFLSYTSSVEKV